MSHDHDDTPPDLARDQDVLAHVMRLSAKLGDAMGYLQRHQNDVQNLRADLRAFCDEVRPLIPKVEELTGRVKLLEGAERASDKEHTKVKSFVAGVVALAGLIGAVVGVLAAAGFLK